ncbi:class I SAM-dependent methyltransferase [Bradyrhizobium sp. 197]|jgi:SAM-dependent methyltransferase|uniref:class I SAM-dependent methyltransferase n=1 Tax=Bradyrhizobium sp. 197 TaxID=2782663 RepID=UPI001FF9A297|nr:class I SAM-dependent methyltransferase [Bradyrhizobium sp. 197]MCK1476553.1 class I SAM-dependent methyltransferase [Bradyrhizobium sp. 197]
MSDRSTHWDNVYATKGEAEVSWFQNTPTTSIAMIRAANPEREAAILDIGGGASRLVDALLQDGYRDVAVLDISANALDAARKRIGAAASMVDWIVADATTWRPAKTYDLWHDRAAFHFLTESRDRTAYIERLRSAVAPGGHVIIATFALGGPEKCSGLPVQRHDSASLAAELGPAFELVETRNEAHHTPWNSTQAFQFSRFKRRSQLPPLPSLPRA